MSGTVCQFFFLFTSRLFFSSACRISLQHADLLSVLPLSPIIGHEPYHTPFLPPEDERTEPTPSLMWSCGVTAAASDSRRLYSWVS